MICDYTTEGTGVAAGQTGQLIVQGDGRMAIYDVVQRLERAHQLRATFIDIRDASTSRVEFALGDDHPRRTYRNAAIVVSEVVVRIR